jgi:hypothetical protein
MLLCQPAGGPLPRTRALLALATAITRNTVPDPRSTPFGPSPLTTGMRATMKEMRLVAANSHTPAFCVVMILTYLSSSA